ncbi:MAG: hypothetical protein KatS3mg064_2110 [Tepidiforma sp.]|nr:hypothetical protein [Tepidiforma sp.]GIW18953.1 MAG: hypothetical protein KatS3mg064_2110 [Tepidiforma sp.]
MLEELFSELDAALGDLDTAAQRSARAARASARASREGEIGRIRRSIEAVTAALPQLTASLEAARERLSRVSTALETNPGALKDEVRELSLKQGWEWQPTDRESTAVVFPVIVTFSGDAVRLDHKPFRGQRPSAVVAGIQRARARFREDASTQSILRAIYRATLYAAGQAQRRPGQRDDSFSADAGAVYEILSLNNPEYTAADFTRHLYLLDRRVNNFIDGYRLSLPASTGTRARTPFRIYGPDGYEHVYYAIRFERVADA